MDWLKPLLDWIAQVGAIAGVLAGPVAGVVGFLKWSPVPIPDAYLPMLSVFIGSILGLILALVVPGAPALVLCVFGGTVAGYGASAAYRAAREAAKRVG